MDGSLRGFCFLLAVHIGDQGDMDESEVLVSNTELELSHCLDKGRGFNIANRATQLNRGKNTCLLD